MFRVYRKHSTGAGLFTSFDDVVKHIRKLAESDLDGVSYSIKRVAATHFLIYRRHPMHNASISLEECEDYIISYQKQGFQGEFEIVFCGGLRDE